MSDSKRVPSCSVSIFFWNIACGFFSLITPAAIVIGKIFPLHLRRSFKKSTFDRITSEIAGRRNRAFKKASYERLSGELRGQPITQVRLINCGYAYDSVSIGLPFSLDATDQQEHIYSWQLVYETVRQGRVEGKEALTVGCGRGGDAYFLKRYMRARSVVGVDFSRNAINFCREFYHLEGLAFEVMDAEHLKFGGSHFDRVVDIESSHCYVNLERFYREVYRVLRPGGLFLYADFFRTRDIDNLLRKAGFSIVHEEDITRNVLRADEEGRESRFRMLEDITSEALRKKLVEWGGLTGIAAYEKFQRRGLSYKRFVLSKT